MPIKPLEERRKYAREWMAKRRKQWLAENGPCGRCGSTERLEIDHIDPALKTNHRVWSWAKLRRDAELAKCRVLCKKCHTKRHHPTYDPNATRPRKVRLAQKPQERRISVLPSKGLVRGDLADRQAAMRERQPKP